MIFKNMQILFKEIKMYLDIMYFYILKQFSFQILIHF